MDTEQLRHENEELKSRIEELQAKLDQLMVHDDWRLDCTSRLRN